MIRTLLIVPILSMLAMPASGAGAWLPTVHAVMAARRPLSLETDPSVLVGGEAMPGRPVRRARRRPTRLARPHRQPVRLRVAAANRAATREPVASGYINAIQVYPWSDGALYRLYAAPGRVSDVALQAGEQLVAVSAGDTVRWVIGDTSSGTGEGRQVHILVKPFAAGLHTNMVVTTDRRTYHLALDSTALTAMAAISWTYPADQLLALQDPAAIAPPAKSIVPAADPDDLHFRYRISGDNPPWRPIQAWDDGHKVYIRFPDRMDQAGAPPLFLIGPTGDSELINYRVEGHHYIVDRLFSAAELRLGGKHQQIVRITRTDAADRRHP